MENQNYDLNNILSTLKLERENVSSFGERNSTKMANLLDNLIETTNGLMHENLEDVIVIGDYVDLRLFCDGVYRNLSINLGFDFNEDTITILSPLGSSIYGKKVGNIVSYKVNGVEATAEILNKNVFLEKCPENIELYNKSEDSYVLKK